MSAKILIQFFHPTVRTSRVNAQILKALNQSFGNDPQVTLREMYEIYPNFFINVALEKEILLHHDHVIFIHPFYWYNCPPLMKLWLDQILEVGFAYGPHGDKLRGKTWLHVISTAASEQAYQRSGANRFQIFEFLRPFEQSATLCQMKYLKPILFSGVTKKTDEELIQHSRNVCDAVADLKIGHCRKELNSAEQLL